MPPRDAPSPAEDDPFRRRLLEALRELLREQSYRAITVADIVRQAQTSRRSFYQHFDNRQDCLVALLREAHSRNEVAIAAAVDWDAPWREQVAQAMHAWIATSMADPAITQAWNRDLPALGEEARELRRAATDRYVRMIRHLVKRGRRNHPPKELPRSAVIMLVGGLRELVATATEDEADVREFADEAVRTAIFLVEGWMAA